MSDLAIAFRPVHDDRMERGCGGDRRCVQKWVPGSSFVGIERGGLTERLRFLRADLPVERPRTSFAGWTVAVRPSSFRGRMPKSVAASGKRANRWCRSRGRMTIGGDTARAGEPALRMRSNELVTRLRVRDFGCTPRGGDSRRWFRGTGRALRLESTAMAASGDPQIRLRKADTQRPTRDDR